MGSCGNLITVNEPRSVEEHLSSELSVHPVTEQLSSLELAGRSYNSSADPTDVPHKCLSSSQCENTVCGCPGNETTLSPFDIKENEIVDVLVSEEMSGIGYASKRAVLDESQTEFDASNIEGDLNRECPLTEHKFRNSFEVRKVASELHPMSASPGNYVQHGDEDENKYVNCSPTGGVIEAMSGVNACAFDSVFSPQTSEMLDKSLTPGWPGICVHKEEQQDANIDSHLSVEEAMEFMGIKDNAFVGLGANVSIQMLREASENYHVTDCGGSYVERNEPRAEKMACPSEQGLRKNSVEKSNRMNDTRADISMQELPLEQELSLEELACNSKGDAFKNSLVYNDEELFSPLSEWPSGFVNKANLEKLGIPDCFERGASGDINCSSVSEFCGKTDEKEKDISRVDYRDPLVVCSNRQSRTLTTKSIQKKQTRRKSRNRAVSHQHRRVAISFEISRRKRSCLLKPARASTWGSLDNITKFFSAHQDRSQVSPKEIGSQVNGKSVKKGASRRAQGSRRNCPASVGCLRVKLKFKRDMGESSPNAEFKNVVDDSASSISSIDDHKNHFYLKSTSDMPKLGGRSEEKLVDDESGRQVQFPEKNMEKEGQSDDSNQNISFTNEDLESVVDLEKAVRDNAGGSPAVLLTLAGEELGGEMQNKYVDSGTSPDSEVINSIPDSQANTGCQEDFHDAVPTSSKDLGAPGAVISTKRGNRKGKHSGTSSKVDCPSGHASLSRAKSSKKCGSKQNNQTGSLSSCGNDSIILTNAGKSCSEPFPFLTETANGGLGQALVFEGGVDGKRDSMVDADPELLQSPDSKNLIHSTKRGKGILKNSNSGKGGKSMFKSSDEGKIRRGTVCRQRGRQKKIGSKCKVNNRGAGEPIMCGVRGQQEAVNNMLDDVKKIAVTKNLASVDASNLEIGSNGTVEQHAPPRQAWVSCDDCHKWRRISPSLLESIENCRWVCKDNVDKAFADCSISQEKSNAEINKELDISDCEEDGLNCRTTEPGDRKDVNDGRFQAIETNEFLHRSRKAQTIDEIMVCHCKPPQDGNLGCGDECLNRMLNIECVQGTCPCGDLCSNQQFQMHRWANLQWFRCGKKGFGLRSLDDISEGQFLIEYVGEVLDMHAYEKRQKEYAEKGHKHFYFMTLNGSEVIDACAKGNLGRFINHSCEPNCRTEKWMVNGEICIGLFAIRDIKKGEELTFDYNYVRVFGAAAKKCYCGSSQCRGYIGGDLLNSEVVVQGDSDEEYPEPVMLYGDGETGVTTDNTISSSSSFNDLEVQNAAGEMKEKLDESAATVRQLELNAAIESVNTSVSAVSQLQNILDLEDSTHSLNPSQQDMLLQKDDITGKTTSSVQKEMSIDKETVNEVSCSNQDSGNSLHKNLINLPSDAVNANMKSKFEVEEKPAFSKCRPVTKTSRISSSVKKGRICNTMNANKAPLFTSKSEMPSTKSKKSLQGSDYGRFEAVEEKLNELLDADGGISKRKDAAKGYLKLLLLTAASGNSNNGEAIQSNRDLSMILDAILKTKSRAVLTDIINKNGLRMLHNIMKQYKGDFKKIPILRKLLKVLEYLAAREILTLEHINGGPPCPGMESFRVSMLSLAEHEDKQVHQIARNFRDRWIPKPLRKIGCTDRDDCRLDFHRGSKCNRSQASQNYWHDHGARSTEAIDCVKHSMLATPPVDSDVQEGYSGPCTGTSQTNMTKTRKRKSRWDQPAEGNPESRSHNHIKRSFGCNLLQLNNYSQQDEVIRPRDGRKEFEDEVPPGFSSPIGHCMVSSSTSTGVTDCSPINVYQQKCSMEVVMGSPQAKFVSRLPVSYGIPLSIVTQHGSPLTGGVEGWVVAPGMPFNPFPPLPPFPRDKKDQSPTCAVKPMAMDQPARQRDSRFPIASGGCTPPTTGTSQPDTDIIGSSTQYTHKRARSFSGDLGRRYFKQQKFSNTKFGPPWLWKRNGWGFLSSNPNNGSVCPNVANDQRGPYCSEDFSCRVDKAGNNFHQLPNQH